ncbi:FecR family protein [Chitinophaga sp. Ak27]|uniref:FecR family protein n=1 Tax=Chitinophaga sp. Ak27 TaxID=2726116 RepID=UPI00145E1075|nr:FecR domain-containing protein [Chitinophaga sp. Ak27]NLU95539.1 FecR family protein [Chitinophaga sp. Ak27]
MTASRFRYLFERYYAQQCTPEEQHELMELMAQSAHDEALKQLLDELLLQATDNDQTMPDDTASNMLQEIMQTNAAPAPARVHTFPVWKRLTVAACTLVAAATAGYIIYTRSHTSTNKPMASVHAPRPKNEHARLVMGNGEEIDLDHTTATDVDVQSGVSVSKKGNVLAYNSAPSVVPTINTVYTNKGGIYQLILPDGTKAWLNAASSISFPTAFKDSTREVTIRGEVYFDIAQQANQPFIVKTNNMKVAVLGTAFNIKAYEEENICTTLLEGAINVSSGSITRKMQPGQQALINREHTGISISRVDTDVAVAWKSGRFEFNDNIKTIMRELARWYDLTVVYEGATTDKSFAGSFSRHDSLKDILRQLELTGSIHFDIADKTITVRP